VSLIVHKRQLGEATHRLIHTNEPEFGDVDAVLEHLGEVLTDMFGVECKVRIHASHAQLRAAIAKAKAEEGVA
jgi:hypothetical protein